MSQVWDSIKAIGAWLKSAYDFCIQGIADHPTITFWTAVLLALAFTILRWR